jgi:hypothetical protein
VLLSPTLFAYFLLDNDGVTPGLQIDGVGPKAAIKIISVLLLMIAVGISFRRFNAREFFCWVGLALPVLIFAVLSLFSGEGFYLQAINAALFLPILFINWRKREARFSVFFGTVSRIIVFQILLSLMFSDQVLSNWENRAMTGGLGNANSFALYCIASFFWFSIVERKFIYALIASAGILLSGSLVAIIVFIVASAFAFNIWKHIGLISFTGATTALAISYLPEPVTRALDHALRKSLALSDFIFNGRYDGSMSVFGRVDYLLRGLELMSDDALSWFWGHPNGLIMFTGDGYFTAILVTHGVVILSLFILYLLMLCLRTGVGNQRLFRFSKILLISVFIYMAANRILDYYPAALLCMLSVGYIVSFYLTSPRASDYPPGRAS